MQSMLHRRLSMRRDRSPCDSNRVFNVKQKHLKHKYIVCKASSTSKTVKQKYTYKMTSTSTSSTFKCKYYKSNRCINSSVAPIVVRPSPSIARYSCREMDGLHSRCFVLPHMYWIGKVVPVPLTLSEVIPSMIRGSQRLA